MSATVYSPSGTTQNDSVSLAQLQSNPKCTAYSGADMNELGRNGFVDVQLSPGGTWALSTVLGCLTTPVPIAAVRGITVIDGQGAPETGPGSTLTPADLAPQGSTDFNNPAGSSGRSGSRFGESVRPAVARGRSGSARLRLPRRGAERPTTISRCRSRSRYSKVHCSPSPCRHRRRRCRSAERVTFSTTVTGQNGSALSYSWNFGGAAQSSTAANPQVTFGTAGQYDVTVQVTDTSGGGGGAEIPITVGTPAAPTTGRHKQTGAGTNKKSHSPSGPRKSKGNHAGGPAGKSNTGKSNDDGQGQQHGRQEHVDYELDDADVDHPRVDQRQRGHGHHDSPPGVHITSRRDAAKLGRTRGGAAGAPDRAATFIRPARLRAAGQRRHAAGGGRQPARPRRARRGRDGAARAPGDPLVAAASPRRGFRGPPAPRARRRARAARPPGRRTPRSVS